MKRVAASAMLVDSRNVRKFEGLKVVGADKLVRPYNTCCTQWWFSTRKVYYMSQRIFTYSLIRAYYDEGKDYIDSFWPFVVKSLEKDNPLTVQSLQEKILITFSLPIPVHSLKVILTRATRNGYITQRNNKIELTDAGLGYQKGIEIPRDVERRLNDLIDDAKKFLKTNHKIDISLEELKNDLEGFLKTNADLIEQYMGGLDITKGLPEPSNGLSEIEQALINYFIFVEKSKPKSYQTLRELITGSVISVILSSRDLSEATKGLSKTAFYFDTNIVFGILGLDIDEVCKPVQELYELLCQENSSEMKIFDFTLDEITRVLRNYISESSNYVPQIKVRSIYSKLKTLGWSRSDLLEYVINIEDKLKEKNILIEPTQINLSKFSLEDSVKEQKIFEYKPEQGKLTKAHDLAAIYLINQKRQRRIHELEKARAFFVTSDKKLANYNYCEWNHVEQGTIAEVLPDSVATNILWLKKPSIVDSVSIEAIISLYSRGLLIDDMIWSRFISILKSLRIKGNIDDKDVALLLYDSRMQDELEKARVSDVSDSWVIEKVESVRQKIHTEVESKIELIQFDAGKEVDSIYKSLLSSLDDVKHGIRQKANKSTNNIIRFLKLIMIVSIIICAVKLAPLYQSNWGIIEPYKDILGIALLLILPLTGLSINIKSSEETFRNWLFARVYKKRLDASEVENIIKKIANIDSKYKNSI